MRSWIFAAAATACSALVFAAPADAGSIKTEGLASWYKMGTRTASGERFDPSGITAAHPSLPFDTKVRVTNAKSGESVVVRINDRGPFGGKRIIDLSKGAAEAISLVKTGIAQVKIEVLGPSAEADVASEPDTASPPEPAPVVTAEAEPQPVTDEPPLRQMAGEWIGSSSR